jgi:hypothetical protein
MRRFEVSHRDNDLPGAGQRVALIGPADTLAWPSLCPNCGQMGRRTTIFAVCILLAVVVVWGLTKMAGTGR